MSINRSTPKNGTSPISYGRPSWNPRCCFVCSLWISTLRSPAKQSAVIFSFALAWEKKTPGQIRQKCTAVRFSRGNLFETFRRGTFRRAAASSLDTSFFNFRFFFNSDLDATQGSLAAAASFWVQLERCHTKMFYMMILEKQSRRNEMLWYWSCTISSWTFSLQIVGLATSWHKSKGMLGKLPLQT